MIRFSYEQKPPRHRRYLWSLALFVVILLIFYVSLDRFSADSTRRQKENLENALQRTITYCYAAEGNYPENLAYLKSHYGLTWDESRFYVDYRVSGANIYPDVTILEKKGEVH